MAVKVVVMAVPVRVGISRRSGVVLDPAKPETHNARGPPVGQRARISR